MLTKEQAMALPYRAELWHMYMKNTDGNPMRCWVAGECKVFKHNPLAFALPVTWGIQTESYITNHTRDVWCLPTLWAIESVIFEGVRSC